LDQFDSKFDELHRQLEFLTRENNNLKTREQQFRDKMNESEKEKNYWREKCRVAEKRGDEINAKITQLESELKTIIFEKQP
jgi:chromosome segregation ATPase